jgi:HK97 family phage major capsid protein
MSEARTHFEAYRKALEALRGDDLTDEARASAEADLSDSRLAMDSALVEGAEDRESDNILEIIERRDYLAKLQAGVMPTERKSELPVEQMREFVDGKINHLSFKIPSEVRTTTDMTTTDTSAYGSYTIPQTWADNVRLFEIAQSGVLQAGPTIINSANANQINMPILSTDMTAAARTEGSANTDSTYPVFRTAALNGYPISGWVSISDEMLRDSGVAMEALLAKLAGRCLGATMASYLGDIDTGTGGAGVPAAITVGVTSAVTAASSTAVTVDELKTLYAGVLPAYRINGKYIANSAVTLSTMLAKDGDGQYLWQPAVAEGQPDRFLGKPWFEDAYFDASAASNIPVVFGDVAAAYAVRLVGDIQVDFSRDYQFPSFETSMRFQRVFDAVTWDALAVKGITLKA